MALYYEWCLLTLNSNDICAQKAETHNAPRTASTTPVLVNYHSGFYHRSAHLPSPQRILEVVNILYNPQSSSSDLLLIYFHHSHLFTKDVGRLSDMTVAYSSNLASESTPPWPPTPTPEGQIISTQFWKMPLLLHPSVFALLLPSAL